MAKANNKYRLILFNKALGSSAENEINVKSLLIRKKFMRTKKLWEWYFFLATKRKRPEKSGLKKN
jgi:hypothetical protein